MRHTFSELLHETGIVVIDGAMSTQLEKYGCSMNDRLWTARVLADQPELVKQVHKDYFLAGADCGITCSYQATIPGLMRAGYTREQAEEIITRSVRIFLEARDEWWNETGKKEGRAYPLCLAGSGPYGDYLADGSEYTGDYHLSYSEMREFHERRVELLWNAGADLLLFETQPSLEEVLVEADIAEDLQADYWVSFSCRDEEHINCGIPIGECAKILSDHQKYPHLRVLGVNCTKPQYVESLLIKLKENTDLPVAVYPNSGEEYDPSTKTWHGSNGMRPFAEYCQDYIDCGADAVGGCCTTVDTHIRDVAHRRDRKIILGGKRK